MNKSALNGGVAGGQPLLKVCSSSQVLKRTQQTGGQRFSGQLDVLETLRSQEHCGGVMLWGCFSPPETLKLVRVDGKMDGATFRATLKERLLEARKDRRRRSRKSQQDNDPGPPVELQWFRSEHIHLLMDAKSCWESGADVLSFRLS